jgi:antitoxin (DNA-binding transcriptional repressor) of toxin-antitoxin stability system
VNYLAVKDLKKTRELWRLLEAEKELIITRDGKPCAVLVGISPEMAHDSISEIRRGLFSLAVRKARQAAQDSPVSGREIEKEVAAGRAERGVS